MKTKQAAKKIQKMGQKGDTILAHINPKEAAMLKAKGGAGKKHPKTGLLQFYEYEGADPMGPGAYDGGGTDNPGGVDPFGGDGGYMAGESPAPGGAGLLGDFGYTFADPKSGGFNWGDALKGAMKGMSLGPFGMLGGGFIGGKGGFQNAFGDLFRGNGLEDPGSGLGMAQGGGYGAGNGFDGPPDYTSVQNGTQGGGQTGGKKPEALPITPPNWGTYGPSPFTFKFGKPRNNAGLLNFGSKS